MRVSGEWLASLFFIILNMVWLDCMAIYDDEVIENQKQQKPIDGLAMPNIRVRNYSGIVISTVHGLCHNKAPLNSELSM